MKSINEMYRNINKTIFNSEETNHLFMIKKRGYISTQAIILAQVINVHYYTIIKAKKHKTLLVENATSAADLKVKPDDTYIAESPYDGVPCDCMQKALHIDNVTPSPILVT